MDNKINKGYQRVPIPGFEGRYEIDTNGIVYSLKTNAPMKPWIDSGGYYELWLQKDGERVPRKPHRLVAQIFIPNPKNYPIINHKDENRLNNAVENLEWCTQKYNMNYGTVLERLSKSHKGRIQSKKQSMEQSDFMKRYRREHSKIKIMCIEDGRIYSTYKDAAVTYGPHPHTIKRSCLRNKKINGYGISFCYVDM